LSECGAGCQGKEDNFRRNSSAKQRFTIPESSITLPESEPNFRDEFAVDSPLQRGVCKLSVPERRTLNDKCRGAIVIITHGGCTRTTSSATLSVRSRGRSSAFRRSPKPTRCQIHEGRQSCAEAAAFLDGRRLSSLYVVLPYVKPPD
jgi:hypothetical protein